MKQNTYYKNRSGETIPADITLIEATPTDSAVIVSPMVSGGNSHVIKWGPKGNKVYKYDSSAQEIEEDNPDFINYWQNARKQAMQNVQWNWVDKIGAFFRGINLPDKNKKKQGGLLMRQGGRIVEVPFN